MKIALSILSLFLTISGFAQKTIWYDSDWKVTSQARATYYRVVNKVSQGELEQYNVKDYYLDGTLQMTGAFSDKRMEVHQGPFVYYHPNGVVSQECTFIDNEYTGWYKKYTEEGQVYFESEYLNGERNGTTTFYNGDGQIFKTGEYRMGEPDGPHLTYFESGELQDEELYENGRLDGTSHFYFKNGKPSSIEYYENDSLVSVEMFNEDGSRASASDELNRTAEFPGGLPAMRAYIMESLNYPLSAIESGIEGRVYISFIIRKNGEISDVRVSKGLDGCPECDEEALRAVSEMPAWTPGISHHRSLDSRYNLPIKFELGSGIRVRKGKR